MLMIVATHTNHGGFSFSASSMTINRLWPKFSGIGGGIENDVFVMLSGYFLITSTGINFRKLLNLWARIFFWSVLLYWIFILSGLFLFDTKESLKALLPVTHEGWWFVSAYFMLYLIHPYLNRLLHSFTREEYKKFLMTSVFSWCLISMLTRANFDGHYLINFICLYSIAGYLRLYAERLQGKKYFLYALGFIVINFLPAIILDVIGLKNSVASKLTGQMFSMMCPFTIAAAFCLIVGFRGLNISHNKFINTIASATFGVYLIHDNNFVRPFLWHDLFHVAAFQDSPYFIPYIITVVLTVYTTCTILELARSKIFKALSRGKIILVSFVSFADRPGV